MRLKIAYATQGRAQYKDVFLLVRGLRKFLNFQVRLGGALGLRRVRPSLRALKSYWQQSASGDRARSARMAASSGAAGGCCSPGIPASRARG